MDCTQHSGMQKPYTYKNASTQCILSWKATIVHHYHCHEWSIIIYMQGHVKPGTAAEIARRLWEMGCYEVSMGDTIGIGTPASVSTMFKVCSSALGLIACFKMLCQA